MKPPRWNKKKDRELVDKLISVKCDDYEVWRYFQERADKLGEQLWSTGTWLMTILAAITTLPFAAGFVSHKDPIVIIKITSPVPVALIAFFGIAFCLYSYVVLLDLRKHIELNWTRSEYALNKEWKESTWSGRKKRGWTILITFLICAFVAFALLFVLSFLKQ